MRHIDDDMDDIRQIIAEGGDIKTRITDYVEQHCDRQRITLRFMEDCSFREVCKCSRIAGICEMMVGGEC